MKNIKSYIELLKANKNLVLTGAPGTGKTYLARQIARAMRAKVEFVQFHPSYSYTDFVEGLRPCRDAAGQIGFKRQDGVFKAFCKDAIANKKTVRKNEDDSQTDEDDQKDLSYYYNVLVDKIANKEITSIKRLSGKEFGVYCENGKTIYAKFGVNRAKGYTYVIIALKQYRLYHSNDTASLAWLQVSLFTWLAIPV